MYWQVLMSIFGQADDVRLDLTAVRGWLDLLHGTSPGLVSIVSTANWSGEFFDLSSQADAAADYVRRLDAQGAQGIYVRTTTLKARPGLDEHGRQKRGDESDSWMLPGFAGDIDIAGPGHKTKHLLPPDVPTAQTIVAESGLPEPTLWVHSGGGVYPWWLLDDPLDISDSNALAYAQEAANTIQRVIQRTAKKLGWHYGGEVGEMARVLRIPGTINRKEDLARPAYVIQPASYAFYDFNVLLNRAILALAALPEEKPEVIREPVRIDPNATDIKVGDDFDRRTDWADILIPNGFEYVCHRGPARMWLRKDSQSGARWSGSTGKANDRDRLYLFTPEVPGFEANRPYTKFAAYTIFEHGGDFRASTKALAALGFGGGPKAAAVRTDVRDLMAPDEPVLSGEIEPILSAPVAPAGVVARVGAVMPHWGLADCSDNSVANYARGFAGQDLRYNTERKAWFAFDGTGWDQDHLFAVDAAVIQTAEAIIAKGQQLAQEDEKAGQRVIKFGASYLNDGKLKATINRLAAMPGVATRDSSFDQAAHLVTLGNGIFDLETMTLGSFDRDKLLTRKMGASFEEGAKAPQFEKFMEQLLPDADLRGYVQRAMGYTLAGQVDHRAIFLLYGPPKTGKSQFLKLMEMIFGSFGGTAASDTLRVTQSTQSNNLHGLKGKRFISTSETSVDTRLDEELIKRLTGGDRIVSRDLYEKNQEWQPECTIFMATNDLPRLSVDDSAIWTRVKPIPFFTQFSKDGENREIHNIAKKLFDEEASGILNWLLKGLAAFRKDGLGEPAAVTASIAQHKQESDVVATFIADALDEAILYEDVDAKISSSQLFAIYQGWSIRQGMRHPIGLRRFVDRMRGLGYVRVKDGVQHWRGLKPGATGMLGTM